MVAFVINQFLMAEHEQFSMQEALCYINDPRVFQVGAVNVTSMPPIKRVINARNPLEIKLYMYFGKHSHLS